MNQDLKELQQMLRSFAGERDWERFHSPKNLAASLSIEAAEVLEHFQWLTEEQSRELTSEKRAEVAQEIADVMLYLLQLCDKLDIDLISAALQKLKLNAVKYPIDKAKGNSRKYTDL